MRARSRVQFFLNPVDCSLLGFSVREIAQARILEWVIIFFSRGFSGPRDGTRISCISRWILYHWTTWELISDFQLPGSTFQKGEEMKFSNVFYLTQ